jgi:hypothetical protein
VRKSYDCKRCKAGCPMIWLQTELAAIEFRCSAA